MKLARFGLRLLNDGSNRRVLQPTLVRTFSANPSFGNSIDGKESNNSFESANDFEKRIFGGISGSSSKSDAFFQKLDRLEKFRNRPSSNMNGRHSTQMFDGLDESFNTLSDGMDWKLKKAATYFEFDPEEVEKEDYCFRPDMNFKQGMTYEPKDLDLRRPGVYRPAKRKEFEVTTAEVLQKADFRNVSFLANFLTDSGIIIKRNMTRISAKAQRKVAREIKTARAFGLLPFTTMGTKSFVFGKTMESLDNDYEYEIYNDHMTAGPEDNRRGA